MTPQHNELDIRLDNVARELAARGLVRAVAQGAWLGLAAFAIVLGLAMWRSWPINLPLYVIGAASLAALYVAADLLLHRPSARRLAERLDARLDLHEQTSTAFEVARQATPPTYLESLLLDRANVTLADAERRVSRLGWIPWREVETLSALLLIILGIMAFLTLGRGLPSISARPLPSLTDATAKTATQPRAAPRPGAGDQAASALPAAQSEALRRALSALAGALGDQAATAAAAEALRQGDAQGAADEMRRLADQADSLSQQARKDLGQALRRGAQAVQQDAPSLAEPLRRAANGVERGGAQAERGLDDLARELERLGQSQPGQQAQAQPGQGQGQAQGQGQQGQGQGQGQQAQGQQAQGQGQGQGAGQGAGGGGKGADDRSGVEGVPVELAAQPDPSQPTTRRADPNAQPNGSASGGGFGQGGAPGGDAVNAPADPLRYPWDLRGVVQEYFTPTK